MAESDNYFRINFRFVDTSVTIPIALPMEAYSIRIPGAQEASADILSWVESFDTGNTTSDQWYGMRYYNANALIEALENEQVTA
jgi:hypothetical protein